MDNQQELKPSPASNFTPAPRRALIELPVSKDAEGKPNSVLLGVMPADMVGKILGGVPAHAKDPEAPDADMKAFWKNRAPDLVAASALSPKVCLGDEPTDADTICWEWLCVMDQLALFNGAMVLNGIASEFPAELGRFLFQ